MSVTARDTFDLLIIVGPPADAPLAATIDAVRMVGKRVSIPPLLVLLSDHSDRNIIALLEAGADDCLPMPFGTSMLLARIQSLLRRAERQRTYGLPPPQVDRYAFDPNGGAVLINGERVPLTAKEWLLATLLFRNHGRTLSRAYLIEAAWTHESGGNSRSLDTHISRIRRKLQLFPSAGYQLTALYGKGYRLTPVECDNLSHDQQIGTSSRVEDSISGSSGPTTNRKLTTLSVDAETHFWSR